MAPSLPAGPGARRLSGHTLLGRAHERVRREAAGDVEGLYALLDPAIRARREAERDDEPERTLAELRAFVAGLRSVELVEVGILEATRRCAAQGGRPAARVRAVVRYNGATVPEESHTVWVRDAEVWYAATLSGHR